MTLRTRLVSVYALAVLAVLAMGVAVVLTQRNYLLDQIDDQLRAAAAPMVRLDPFQPAPGSTEPLPPRPDRPGVVTTMWVAEVDAAGELRALSSVLSPADEPSVEGAELLDAPLGVPFSVPSSDGGAGFRMLVLQAGEGEPGGPGPRLAFAMPLDDTEAAIGRLTTVVLWGGLGILTVLGLSGWWVWRLGLRPIREMTDAAERMAQGAPDLRVPTATEGTEAAMLADALNAMLEARQRNEEQLRRFVGDASHELRTPLTSVRGYAELYQRGALEERADLDDAMRRILSESDRMAVLVEDLLLLARLDQGRPLSLAPLDLAAVLEDAAADARAVSPRRQVSVEVPHPLVVTGDEHRLRQVVAGLVGNALVHTDAPVHLRAGVEPGGGASVWVRDEGPGMDARTAQHAFDRFYRGDPARSRHTGGSGLGLAIARSVVEAHGGRIALRSSPGQGCTVELHLPAEPPTAPVASATPAGTVQG
jgi:two-component system OmpR family sensor kinase